VCGKYNKVTVESDIFIVGNGTDTNKRSNAFVISADGTAHVGSELVTSDVRVKDDIEDIGPDDAREFVMGLAPKSFTKFGNREVGFIAQEVEGLPFGDMLVDRSPNHGYDDFRSLSYDGMIAPLVRFVQDMSRRIDGLEARVRELEDENATLLRRIDASGSGAEGGGL
jgi:hypothetical protein